jgi:hypothetical protein
VKKLLGDWRIYLIFAVLQLPSLRALVKYALEIHWLLIPLYLIGTFLFIALLLNGGVLRKHLQHVSSLATFSGLLLLILVANLWLYPIADAREEQGKGSDQDDALIITGERLWLGNNPYVGEHWPYLSAAAGPGWVLLASPLAANGLYVLLNPLILALTAGLIVYLRRSYFAGVIFLLLLMSSLAFWELTVVGSDMISIGCLILLATIVVYHGWQKGGWAKFLSGVFLAFIATSRAVFFYLIPLLAYFQRKRAPKSGLNFLLISGGVFIALNLIFYFWNPRWYLPMYVLWRGERVLGVTQYITAGLVCLTVFYFAARRVRNDLPSWILNHWITLAVAMGFAGLGDLWASHFQFAFWEGANYLGVAIPGYAAYLALTDSIETNQ